MRLLIVYATASTPFWIGAVVFARIAYSAMRAKLPPGFTRRDRLNEVALTGALAAMMIFVAAMMCLLGVHAR
jgi:hypothetical protein